MLCCTLYSSDGFDIAELQNLVTLYRRLGFHTCIETHPGAFRPSLLVIVRGQHIDGIEIPDGTPVHIFNYVGYDMSEVVQRFRDNPVLFITPRKRIGLAHGVRPAQVVESGLPVYVDLWTGGEPATGALAKYRAVHIGNRKHYPDAQSDTVVQAFERFVLSHDVAIWGRGWENIGVHSRGHLSPYSLGSIYSDTDLALGIMYPLQRSAGTYSSRFWQAPIHGATLLSEPSEWIGIIPGVQAIDYLRGELPALPVDRTAIARQSREYWTRQTSRLESLLERHLKTVGAPCPVTIWRHRPRLRGYLPMMRERLRALTQGT